MDYYRLTDKLVSSLVHYVFLNIARPDNQKQIKLAQVAYFAFHTSSSDDEVISSINPITFWCAIAAGRVDGNPSMTATRWLAVQDGSMGQSGYLKAFISTPQLIYLLPTAGGLTPADNSVTFLGQVKKSSGQYHCCFDIGLEWG